MASVTTLRGEIRGNDTVLEHFPQLVILLITIFAGKTSTKLDPGLSLPARIFIDENAYFLWTSAFISLLSICIGHIVFIVTLNGSFKTFKGVVLMIPYYLVSVVARVFYILIFFTPFLGLLDVSHHGTQGYKWNGPDPAPGFTLAIFDITGGLSKSWLGKNNFSIECFMHFRKWNSSQLRGRVETTAIRRS